MGTQDRHDTKTGRPQEAYGGASVEERAEVMRAGVTDEEITARNVIPTSCSNGQPHRVLAEEFFL